MLHTDADQCNLFWCLLFLSRGENAQCSSLYSVLYFLAVSLASWCSVLLVVCAQTDRHMVPSNGHLFWQTGEGQPGTASALSLPFSFFPHHPSLPSATSSLHPLPHSVARSFARFLLFTTCLHIAAAPGGTTHPPTPKAPQLTAWKGLPTPLQQLPMEHMTKCEGVTPESRSEMKCLPLKKVLHLQIQEGFKTD